MRSENFWLGDQEEAFRELVTAHLPKEKRRKI